MLNVKLLLLLQSVSLSLVYPFINLHMVSLGFTRSQVTETNIIICFLDILVPVLTGVLADNVDNFKRLIQTLTAINGVSSLCLAAVPHNSLPQYLLVRILFEASRSAVLCLSEGALSLLIKEHKADYGRLKILASLAPLVVTPMTGRLLDQDSAADQKYLFVFSSHCLLRLLSLPLIAGLHLGAKTKSQCVGQTFKTLLRRKNVQRFLITFVVLGALWGLVETYLFISLTELGISKQSLGLSQSLATVTGLLVHLVSGLLLRRLGYDLLISLTFTLYSLRLFGYSLVKESHHLFLCEMLKPFGNSLAMTLGSHYVSANTNGDDTATLEGLFGSGYFGIGKAVGIFVGGTTAGQFGYQLTWRMFSLFSLITGLAFFATSTKKTKTK